MFGSDESIAVAPSFSMAKKKKPIPVLVDEASDERVAERAKRLRLAFNYKTVPPFAAFLRIEPKRWYNVENGFPLGKDLGLLLVQRIPGLTLEWLWLGRTDRLTIDLARRLDVLDRDPENA